RAAERSSRAAPRRAARRGLSSPLRVCAEYSDGMSLSIVAWPLRTARLEIRPLEDADLDAMWEFRRLPEVNRWLGRAPATREAFRETYSDPARRAMTFVIVLPDAGGTAPAIIGDLMIKLEDAWAQAE